MTDIVERLQIVANAVGSADSFAAEIAADAIEEIKSLRAEVEEDTGVMRALRRHRETAETNLSSAEWALSDIDNVLKTNMDGKSAKKLIRMFLNNYYDRKS